MSEYNYDTDIGKEKEIMEEYMTLNSDGCFIDVGAHIGHWTVYMGKGGNEVHSFEPFPDTFKRLEENTKNYPNVYLYRLALGEVSDHRHMFLHRRTEKNGLRLRYEDWTTRTIMVEVRPLDEFCFSKPIGLIKVDTEGYEGLVLAGAVKTVSRDKPRIILEVHSGQHSKKEEIKVLSDILHTMGYRIRIKFKKENKQPIIIADYRG